MNKSAKTKQQLISEMNLLSNQIKKLQSKEIKDQKEKLVVEKNNQQSKDIIDNSPLGMITVDKTGKILTVNKKLIQILGSPSAEATLKINVLKYVPMIESKISAAIIDCMETGNNLITEHPYVTKWRKKVHFKLHLAPIRNKDGKIDGCQTIVEDISETKKNEEYLKLSEECFRAIADNTYNWESWFGTDGTLLWVNPAVERVTGYTVEECLNMEEYPLLFVYEKDLKIMEPIIRRNWGNSSGENVLFRIRHKYGSLVWISVSWKQIFGSNQSPLGTRTSFYNVTDHIKIENALEEKEQQFRLLFENSKEAMIMFKRDRIGEINNAARKILKYDINAELISKKLSDLSPENQPDGSSSIEKAKEMISTVKEQTNIIFDWEFLDTDGQSIIVQVSLTALKFKSRTIIYLIMKK